MRVRDPIHGVIPVGAEEKAIVDSRAYQRLRHVRQLGFGDLAFPGATHTRHAHSLGAMHVSSRVFDAVAAQSDLSPAARERFRAAVRLAVLCHDLGHMPLSHASERIAPRLALLGLPAWVHGEESPQAQASHEDFTVKLLLDSPLRPVLDATYARLGVSAADAASLIVGRPAPGALGFVDQGVDWAPLLRAIVSGELDADRMDYLLRDSFYTGVNYGRYDLEWLVQNLAPAQVEGRAVLALSRAAVFAFEDFLLSRYHMFLSVYYHHTSVSFDFMLQRYYREAPGEFSIPADPQDFLHCDDVALWSTLRRSDNPWARRLVERRGYKRVAQFTELDEGYDVQGLSRALDEAGIAHFTVESVGTLSSYLADGAGPSLYVVDPPSGRLTEVARYTPLYQRFGALKLTRLYAVPEEAEAAAAVVARATVEPRR